MLLKKAGMVVLAAGAGMVALTPAAFAGDAPSSSSDSGHSWGGDDHGGQDHGWGHGHHKHSKDKGGASATNGDCANFGSQLVGANCTNVQAPINQLGVLSKYDNHGGSGANGASAKNGDSANFGDQLIGLNGTNVQAPINQLGVLSSYDNH
ncbi:hypothetical protein [Actinomycetospora sp.]|jgi:hypothetical protein|uniref:hypothetical protein n=1 Tax=Actinomycetospora sp. TaxID=1872135 RepID=UPI002F429B62